MTDVYRIHGLRIRSERPLDALPAPDDGSPIDLDVVWGDAIDEADMVDVEGDIVARAATETVTAYTAVRTETGYLFRFNRFADAWFTDDLRRVEIRPRKGDAETVVPMVVTGAIASFYLELTGHCVLHASAVQHNDRAVAFAGPSGAGKTTAAALASVAGNPLVADDVLRVEFDTDDNAWCFSGGPTLRLRPVVESLADLVPNAPRAMTPDGRIALNLSEGRADYLPLRAIVMPTISAVDQFALERVSGADAFVALASAPRVVGWLGDYAKQQFDALTDIARVVPVFRGTIPWKPGDDVGVADRLLDCIESALS